MFNFKKQGNGRIRERFQYVEGKKTNKRNLGVKRAKDILEIIHKVFMVLSLGIYGMDIFFIMFIDNYSFFN